MKASRHGQARTINQSAPRWSQPGIEANRAMMELADDFLVSCSSILRQQVIMKEDQIA